MSRSKCPVNNCSVISWNLYFMVLLGELACEFTRSFLPYTQMSLHFILLMNLIWRMWKLLKAEGESFLCHARQEILTASASSHEQVIPAQVPLSLAINLSWAGGQSYVCFMSLTDVTGVCMNTIDVHKSISNLSRNVQTDWQKCRLQVSRQMATLFGSVLGPLGVSQHLGCPGENHTRSFRIMFSCFL